MNQKKFYPVIALLIFMCFLCSSCLSQRGIRKPTLVTEMDEKRLEGLLDGKFETNWAAIRTILYIRGDISFENSDVGQIRSLSGTNRVEIRYTQLVADRGLVAIKVFDTDSGKFKMTEAKHIYIEIQRLLSDARDYEI